MDKKLLKEMNDQINKEIFSGYLYLSMAAHFEEANLPGFAHWMKLQAGEELEHGMKFFDFLTEVGEHVELEAIEKPDTKFGTPVEIFEQTLEHEKFVTGRIHDLFKIAVEVADYRSQVFLQWFVNEQIEEEATATMILEQLKMLGESGSGLLMLDKALGERSED